MEPVEKGSMTDVSKSQIDKFKEAARGLQTDDDEQRFNEKLGKIARRKPANKTKVVEAE